MALLKMHRTTGDPSSDELAAFADGIGLDVVGELPILNDMLVLSHLDLVRWAADRRPDLLAEYMSAARTVIADWAQR